MVIERQRRAPRGRGPLTVALLAGWVVVVVVGAGRRPDESPLLGVTDLGAVLLIPLALLALLGLFLLVYLKPEKSDKFTEPDRRRRSILVLMAVVILLLVWRPDLTQALQDIGQEMEASFDGPAELVQIEREPAAETVAEATDILLLAFGIALVGAVWYLARRRGTPALGDTDSHVDEALEAELIVAMDEAVAQLDGDDPRTAVLNAYASLEHVLATQQRDRRQSETRSEHLQRVLSTVRIDPAPLVELGSLYQLARFSTQEISADQQRDARDALDRARNELAALA